MCIDFEGHHSDGSSFDYVIRCGPYPQVSVGFKKKKKKKSGQESQHMVSCPGNRFGSVIRVGPGIGA